MFAPSAVFRSKMLRICLQIDKGTCFCPLKSKILIQELSQLPNLPLEQQCTSKIFSIVGVFSICTGVQLRMLKCILLKCSSAQMPFCSNAKMLK